MNQSAFKEICSIAIRLTVTCLIAGVIMGTTFLLTHDAKEHNEQLRDERVMYELLGYGKGNPAPQTMSMHTMYRYVLAQGESQSVAYVLPTVDGKYVMVELDLEGRFVKQYPLEGDAAKMRKETDRTGAVAAAISAFDSVERLTDDVIRDSILPALKQLASEISFRMGHSV